MKDELVERVLAGLGKVEAPAGLEGRVLRRLEERAGRRSGAQGWVWGMGWAAMGLAAMVLVAMVLAGAFVARRGLTAPPQTIGLSKMGHPGSAGLMKESAPEGLKAASSGAAYPKGEAAGLTERRTKLFAGRGAAAGHVSEARDAGPGSVARMESFPAPPEPLTEQERLLRQIALTGSEPAFELLNEETREAAMAASDAEFEAFVRSTPRSGRPDGRELENLDLQR